MIVEFINEIKGQVNILKSYYEDLKRSEYFGILNQKENESYFFGLGDSYAASIAVSELTGCVYGEPYEWQYKKLPFGKNFIFISVSGKTNANINLAKKAKELKNRIIVITGNRDSELAKIANLVIDMNYKEKIILPGTLSFTKSLVASFSLFGIDLDFEIIKREYEKSKEKRFGYFGDGSLFILASPLLYPIAYYWKAKTAETTGIKAFAERVELFSHVDLFFLNRNDGLIILSRPEDKKAQLLFDSLSEKINFCIKIDFSQRLQESYIIGSFYAQLFSYNLMRTLGKYDFNFSKSEFLEFSNRLIY